MASQNHGVRTAFVPSRVQRLRRLTGENFEVDRAYTPYGTLCIGTACGTVTTPYAVIIGTILEGLGVLLASTAICGAAGISAAVAERKSTEEINRWGQIGTAIGFSFGVPLTICAFVLLQRSS